MSEIDTSTAAIEALMDGVTAGPWLNDSGANSHCFERRIVTNGDECVAFSDGANACFISASRYLVPALAAERDALKAEVERLRAALGAEQDSADEMADVLSACGDGLMFDVDRLQAALDHHDALREAAIRAIPMPTDAAAALDSMTALARAQGMREAAEIAAHRYAVCEDAYSKGLGAEERHCALEAKHIEDKILARAEEIEKEARNG